MKDKNELLSTKKMHELRILVGQLNWLATHTRPDIYFDCCELTGSMKEAKIADMIKANKILQRVRSKKVVLKFRSIRNC